MMNELEISKEQKIKAIQIKSDKETRVFLQQGTRQIQLGATDKPLHLYYQEINRNGILERAISKLYHNKCL